MVRNYLKNADNQQKQIGEGNKMMFANGESLESAALGFGIRYSTYCGLIVAESD